MRGFRMFASILSYLVMAIVKVLFWTVRIALAMVVAIYWLFHLIIVAGYRLVTYPIWKAVTA